MIFLVREKTLTTNKNNEITVSHYGEERFQSTQENGRQVQITANDYGFNSLKWIIDEVERARENGEDRIILLGGEVRTGKSNLGAHLAARLGLSDISSVCYSGKGYLKQITEADEGDVCWLDEGGRGMYYKNWMKKENKLINQMFQQIGAKNLVSIICLPHKNLLDKELRQMRVHYWGQVKFEGYDRGFVKWRIAGKRHRQKGEIKVPRHHHEWEIKVYWEPLFKMRFPKFREHNNFSWEEYEQNKMDKIDEFGEEALEDMEGDEKISPSKLESEKKKARVEALLRNTDLTQAEIGQRVDLSRSRVADISLDMEAEAEA